MPLVQELHVVPALVALAREKARDARFDAARALSHLACCEDNHVLLYDQVSRLLSYFKTISCFVIRPDCLSYITSTFVLPIFLSFVSPLLCPFFGQRQFQ